MATRAYMYKRPIMKKSFFKSTDYKGRWFILQDRTLSYYDGAAGVSTDTIFSCNYLHNIFFISFFTDLFKIMSTVNIQH